MFWYLGDVPDETGVAILAPNSLGSTWESIGRSGFGEDAAYLNRALQKVFETTAIDPGRIALGGFSDGASYALSIGLMNGDFFKSLIAFSPGYALDAGVHGKPRVYISHGTHDRILPIDRCGRRVASELKARGYDVTFHEFDGDHEIPADICREGFSFI